MAESKVETEKSVDSAPATAVTTVQETKESSVPNAKPKVQNALFAFLSLLVTANPSWLDIVLLVVGTIAAAAAGVPFPLMGILFGQLVDDINLASCEATATGSGSSYTSQIQDKVVLLVYIAIAAFALIYIYVLCWNLLSQRLGQRLSEQYFRCLLRQDAAFFDRRSAGEVASKLNGDIQAVQSGTSEKVGIFIASISFFLTAYIVAFMKEAKLAGMLVSLVPAFLLMGAVGGSFVQKFSLRISNATASAASIASEALTHVAVVQAFDAAPRLESKFSGHMEKARKAGIKKAITSGVQAGLLFFIAYSANALAFWQGSRLVAAAVRGEGGSTVGEVYTVVFLLVDACVMLGAIAPLLPLFGTAASAFQRLRADIAQTPEIDGTNDTGRELAHDTPGAIEFRNVSFVYSSRPDDPVLKDIDLSIPAGQHTALVGISGSGKSTIAALIARLYDPSNGSILFDGSDVRELNLRSLRGSISLVPQEPLLLDRSIFENIALGLVSSPQPQHQKLKELLHGPELTEFAAKGDKLLTASTPQNADLARIIELVREASDLADATDFIGRLDHGFCTMVGSSGKLVSGGQRQRIALARAIIRDPKLLILDEATSSLDSASEQRIQMAIDRIAKGRTVVSIAHRLSTVKNADNIIVLRKGEIVEQGTYTGLVSANGAFAEMARLQAIGPGQQATDSDLSRPDSINVSSDITTEKLGKIKSVEHPVKDSLSAQDAGAADTVGETNSQEPEEDIDTKHSAWIVIKGMFPFVRPNTFWLLLAMFAAIFVGCMFSAAGLIFGHTVGALNPCLNTAERIISSGLFFGGLLFMLACVEFLANCTSWSSFGVVAERLLYKIRVLSFRSLFQQSFEWHHSHDRNPSSLLSIITKDSAAVGGLTGSIIGTIFAVVINMLVAIILSHIVAWKIAIVCLVTVPVLLGSGIMQLWSFSRFETRHANAYSKANAITFEAVNSIKTIATLSLEDEVLGTYRRALHAPRKELGLASVFTNFWLALANSTGFLIYAFAYWWGSKQIMEGRYDQTQFFIVLVAMLVSAQLWGQMFSLAPEVSRAHASASRILNLINLGSDKGSNPPQLDGDSPTPATEKDIEAVGEAKSQPLPLSRGVNIEFNDVSFSYPSAANVSILQGMSFTIRPGQFCGLVGPSGAGKSTIMRLIQGLYNPPSGSVTIDGLDLSRPDAAALRDDIAVVPQDTALFDGTIRFNVALGARRGHEATDAEIEAACRLANIHETIAALPDGYDTEIGPNGSRLSGGQRQRVAIARALVRKPRLLLLDESTNALDAESEAAVQDGLDQAAKGITVVAITHRLRTVQAADVILVLEEGKVVQTGNHEELMATSESYRVNAERQMLR
ncbi:P-loop containing nucleoside triphosphate hydrolase protein [Eremomyces bilateralis CBS 781.70]|uniref:P-loop containing nucleoside triphosphate hydrolase protein n=1 Tax=Eremomyces bilateralis CBS 781.70 TaxID=1392243 RepID=A0A6G1G3I0_9PEZI|nr:P-loop containing nucleoside triphosphate hydrolase protein [Eremomyces bilateralis CBS 781.70]KAF1812369.1 P-loop containing nucleoside triphosphate hydrolase protein [Eremomyces bilateralis CBS 781.70]